MRHGESIHIHRRGHDVAFVSVDGLSHGEEYVASALYESFGNVPFVGGSAAASQNHPKPAVYFDGQFVHDAAVLALFETKTLAFETFVTQHFVPSETKLVVTLADDVMPSPLLGTRHGRGSTRSRPRTRPIVSAPSPEPNSNGGTLPSSSGTNSSP